MPQRLGFKVIKLFSCSTHLSVKFVLLINLKLLTISVSLNMAEHEIFSANKCGNANYLSICLSSQIFNATRQQSHIEAASMPTIVGN